MATNSPDSRSTVFQLDGYCHHALPECCSQRLPGRGSANVKCAHSERTGLANRLGSITPTASPTFKMSASQVSPVARPTNTVSCFAGNRRTHHHLINTEFFEFINPSLVNQRATLTSSVLPSAAYISCATVRQVLDQPGPQRYPTFDDRSRKQTRGCAAISSVITTSWATSTKRRVK